MDLKNVLSKLHPLECKVLPLLRTTTQFPEIIKKSRLQEAEVMRALQWLENKGVLKILIEKNEVVTLDKNGERYSRVGLPEKAFLKVLIDEFKSLAVLDKKSKLTREEINVSLGLLKKKGAIETEKRDVLYVRITNQGKKILTGKNPEEEFLQSSFPLHVKELSSESLALVNSLRFRKDFIRLDEVKKISVSLTPLGEELSKMNLDKEVVNRLTPHLLRSSDWKKKHLRAYDVEINVPQISGGRKHFDNEAIDYIKRIWLDLGFKEITGNYVQSAFWDLDALFVPQDHPAREMQDTFYLPGVAKLPSIWTKIKEVHENGGKTGSKGWGYTFSTDESSQLLLRTHTTVLSAQTLSNLKKEDLPAKFFMVGKVFRNEALDWKHLFEFYQIDGIVVDPHANLSHLKGYLTQFYKKMGYEKVRMRPAHFPYTEPSLEVDVYHAGRKQWIELGGAGIFRPEVVIPLLGFECPVLAWGQGMGRIISEYWKITDIRDLYKNDLAQLRAARAWLR